MDAARQDREARKKELLQELAELRIEEMVEQGVFLGTPHYSIIERYAITLGRELSREAQERAAREVAANSPSEADCPACGTTCRVQTATRSVTSLDGPVAMTETTAHCNRCRRSFFPSAGEDGTR
jgi:uncharacterized protein with PIN domain